MPDLIAAYQQAQGDVVSVMRSVPEDDLLGIVPACPDWTIKDLLAHLVHVSETYAFGLAPYDTEGIEQFMVKERDTKAIDAWTDQGVVARRGRPLDELVDEWTGHTYGPLQKMMRGETTLPAKQTSDLLSWVVVGDLAVHVQDVRGAVGIEPNREAYATKLSYASYTQMVTSRTARAGVPPLRVVTQRSEVDIGTGEPERTLEADWYEFLRMITGRRSAEQVRELFGDIDAEPYLGVISNGYPLASSPLKV